MNTVENLNHQDRVSWRAWLAVVTLGISSSLIRQRETSSQIGNAV